LFESSSLNPKLIILTLKWYPVLNRFNLTMTFILMELLIFLLAWKWAIEYLLTPTSYNCLNTITFLVRPWRHLVLEWAHPTKVAHDYRELRLLIQIIFLLSLLLQSYLNRWIALDGMMNINELVQVNVFFVEVGCDLMKAVFRFWVDFLGIKTK